jgi:hypothetical protein
LVCGDILGVLESCQALAGPTSGRRVVTEDVSISLEEADERVFLFRVKARPDHGCLATVACPKINCLDLHFLRW